MSFVVVSLLLLLLAGCSAIVMRKSVELETWVVVVVDIDDE